MINNNKVKTFILELRKNANYARMSKFVFIMKYFVLH